MKAKFILIVCCAVLALGVKGQANFSNHATTGMGALIVQLTNNISPDAFTPEFLKNKKGWQTKAQVTNDPKGVSWLLKSLSAGLKPSAYNANWAAISSSWTAKTENLKTVNEAASQLSALSANLAPNTMLPGWKDQDKSWKETLNIMAK